MTEEIERVIDLLISRFGPLGEHVWSVYVRQAWLEGVLYAFGLILSLLSLSGAFLITRMLNKKSNMDDTDGWSTCFFMLFLFGIVGFILCLIGLPRIINPEYYAFQKLLGR